MILYVIGFTRAGKTTLANNLALIWHIPVLDTDDLFRKAYQTSIEEFVSERGWPAFREHESSILLQTLKYGNLPADPSRYSAIIACGGGVVELPANIAFLQNQHVLWLAPNWDTLISRIRQSPSAYCVNKSEIELKAEYERRLPLYRKCIRTR